MKIPSRLAWILSLIAAGMVLALPGRAQTTILTESFADVLTPAWTVGDSNAAAPALWWGSVSELYGSVPSHTRGGKGYCAALGVSGFINNSESYSNNLSSTMSRTINLVPYTYANLRFWGRVPSIGAGDSWRTYVGNTIVVNSAATTTSWVERRLSLNAYTGASHLLRFVFISDSSGVAEGLYLDDIEVTGSSVPLTERISSLSIPNYSGYVIDSDAANTNTAFNRDTINATTVVASENFSGVSTSLVYVLTYRLRETNGALFPIYNASGTTTNVGYTHVTTNVSFLTSAQESNMVATAFLKPAARLNHLTRYRVEVNVARQGAPTSLNATNGPLHYYHFTNLVSGDAAFNVIAEAGGSGWERTWLLDTAPGTNAFLVTNEVVLHRYDSFLSGAPSLNGLPLRFDLELRNATSGALIPLAAASTNLTVFSASYQPGTTSPVEPRVNTNIVTLAFRPAAQLDSVNATYRAIVRVSYTNQVGQPSLAAGSVTNAPQRLLAYNGRLLCGDINTTMHAFSAAPIAGVVTIASNVATTVSLALNGATVDGLDGPSFGDGSGLGMKLLVNGDAILTGGVQIVNNASEGTVGNISFDRGVVAINSIGSVVHSITFHMPTGFGYHTNYVQGRVIRRLLTELSFPNIGLNQNLAPKTNLTFFPPPGETIYAAEESKAIWILATQMVWNATSSRFELLFSPTVAESFHVRGIEYEILRLVSTNLYQTNMAVKRSNDRYLNHTLSFTGAARISADAAGNALLNGTLAFAGEGAFQTHFPYDSSIEWSGGGGFMVISNDVVLQGGGSYLAGVGPVIVPYVGDCEGCSSTPLTNRIGITPAGGRLSFTRDGGLMAGNEGPILYENGSVGRIAWGYNESANDHAQAVIGPTNAVFAMPGAFLRGGDNTASADQGAAVILYTGGTTGSVNLIERPATSRYALGFADYAGLNVRGIADGMFDARSVIAGQAVTYDLRGNSKYYLRLGGVSGIHSGVGGSFPASLTLWGYSFGFSNYSLAFLDNLNVKSRTSGGIFLPDPSDITVEFAELEFTCSGKPLDAVLPDRTEDKILAYWLADITGHSIQFVSNVGAECDVDDGFLTLSVTGHAAPLEKSLAGTLGFFPNGKLISKSDGISDIDSRLKMPSVFEMKGASNATYQISSVGDAYYNRHNPAVAPDGFITFAGLMDVPFFEEIQMQIHTSARKHSTNPPRPSVYLMGGWRAGEAPAESLGWIKNGESFFNAVYFDEKNDGWPSGSISLDGYRNNVDGEKYHARAHKVWLDIVDLDYTLRWKVSERTFESFKPVKSPLIIFELEHQVRAMDAKAASLDFGSSFGKINTADFFLELLDDGGVFTALSEAIGESEFLSIVDSMVNLQKLLDATGGELLETALDPALDPDMELTYQGLKSLYDGLPSGNKTAFPALADTYLNTNFLHSISNKLFDFSVGSTQAVTILSNITFFTTNAISGSQAATNAFGNLSNIVEGAVWVINLFSSEAAKDAGKELHEFAKGIEPTLMDITATLHQINIALTNAAAAAKTGGEWANNVRQIALDGRPIIGEIALKSRADIKAYLNTFDYTVDNPFAQVSKASFKDRMRREVRDAFAESSIWDKIFKGVKYRLSDLNSAYRSGVDGYFNGINGLVRFTLESAFNYADDTINSALGDVSGYVGAAKITGHAVIEEDSLRELRLDAKFEFKMPEKMTFSAFLQIKEIDSENQVEACIPAGGRGTEITLGALDVPLLWSAEAPKKEKKGKEGEKEKPKDSLTVDITTKFVLDAEGEVSGMGGSILAKGTITLGTLEIKQFGLNLMFGETENYGAALCRVSVSSGAGGKVEIGGGLFAGVTCTYDPIMWTVGGVSPALPGLLKPETNYFGPLPAGGALFFADGEFPIQSYSCLLEIRVIVGAGAWYFAGGDYYGMLMRMGVSGTVVCVLNGKGVATLVGAPTDEGFALIGTIVGEGCLGPCPLCICGNVEKTVKYLESTGWEEVPDKEDR